MKMPDTCPVCGAKGPTVEFIDNAVAIVGKFVLTAESAPAAPRFCFDCKRLEEKDVEATHSCSCGDGKHVCGSCMLSHAHKGHKPVPLDLLASVGVDFCSKHPDEKVKVFCLDDSTATCTICAVLDHKAHNVTDLGTACSLFAPQLVGALQTLEDGCSILSNRIAAVVGERDALLATTASSEIAANASFDALHASIEAQKASGVRALYQVRDQRAVALNRQSTVLQHGLAQILDGVTVAKQALEKRNPSLMAYALKSVGVLSRIPAHAYNGPCESSVLSLDVDTTALVDALPRAFALRQVVSFNCLYICMICMISCELIRLGSCLQASDEPEFVATTISDLMKENVSS